MQRREQYFLHLVFHGDMLGSVVRRCCGKTNVDVSPSQYPQGEPVKR